MPLRLFIAAYPPPEVAAGLVSAAESLSVPSLKPSPIDRVHITLLFIGDTDERQVPEVVESMTRAASGVAEARATIARLIGLPERGHCRLIAAEASVSRELLEVQRRLARRLARARAKREGVFLPHLTLGRFPGTGVALERREWAAPNLEFVIREIRLMASTLAPRGAIHREVSRFGLTGGESGRDAPGAVES